MIEKNGSGLEGDDHRVHGKEDSFVNCEVNGGQPSFRRSAAELEMGVRNFQWRTGKSTNHHPDSQATVASSFPG